MSKAQGQFTIIDYNDALTLTGYIGSNHAKTQMYNPDNGSYNPDWSSTNLVLTPSLYVIGTTTDQIASSSVTSVKWYIGSSTTAITTSGSYALSGTKSHILTVKGNVMAGLTGIDYRCVITYKDAYGSWYIYLPKFRVDDTSAYFEGTLSAPSGNIGGFTIGSSSIYKTKSAYSNTTAGVYIGTDGIGLGAGTFYVTSAGALTATSATITGAITATSGSVKNMTVTGRLYFGNNSSYYIDANYNDSSYYIYLPGFRVDDASGAVFSGKLSAASGSFSGTITATGGKIGSLSITDGGLLYGSVSGNTATGVKINTTTVWAKYSYFTSGSIGCWGYSSSGMSASYSSVAGFNGNDVVYLYPETLRYKLYGNSTYPNVRWQTIVDIINTASSDRRIKKNIEPLSDSYDLLFDGLVPKRYKYIDGTSKRYHTGFVAQEVVDAIENAGLSLSDFAAVMLECPGSEKETWKLRRDEFVALNTWQIQKLKKRIAELEAKLEAKEGC